MTEKIKEIINNQINEELYSAYLYLAFSARLDKLGFKGAANWMKIQVQEENDHALGFFYFLLERGEEPKLKTIVEPKLDGLNTLSEMYLASLNHEKHITACINSIYELAREEKDYSLESFVKWYIDEQVEEEANVTEIVDKLKLIGDNGSAIYMIDQELKARIYTPSAPYAVNNKAQV
jgi:ferritin